MGEEKKCDSKHTFMSFLLGMLVGIYPMRWMTILVAFAAGVCVGLALPLVHMLMQVGHP